MWGTWSPQPVSKPMFDKLVAGGVSIFTHCFFSGNIVVT